MSFSGNFMPKRFGVGARSATAEISGHPTLELEPMEGDEPVVITVCAECGEMRSVLWLTGDRWYCRNCKHVGENRPNMIPIA